MNTERCGADCALEHVNGNVGLVENQLDQLVVVVGSLFQQMFTGGLSFGQHRFGNIAG